MSIDRNQLQTAASLAGLLQFGASLALGARLPPTLRITSAALGALSVGSLLHQFHRSQTAAPSWLLKSVGGWYAWEALPVYDPPKKQPGGSPTSSPAPARSLAQLMTAPVMRGRDRQGEPQLFIRFKPRDLEAFLKKRAADIEGLNDGDHGYAKIVRKSMKSRKYPVLELFRSQFGNEEPTWWTAVADLSTMYPLEHKAMSFQAGKPAAHAELQAFIEKGGNKDYELV